MTKQDSAQVIPGKEGEESAAMMWGRVVRRLSPMHNASAKSPPFDLSLVGSQDESP